MDSLVDIGYAPPEDATKQHGVHLDDLYVKWDIKLYEELFWMLQLANECGFDTPEEFVNTREYSCFRFWWDDHWQLFTYKKVEVKPNITTDMSIEELQQALADAKSEKNSFVPVINNKFDLSHYNTNLDTESDLIYKPVSAVGVKFDHTDDNYDFEGDLQGFMPTWSHASRMRAAYGLEIFNESCERLEIALPEIEKFIRDNPEMSPNDQMIHSKKIWEKAFNKKIKLNLMQIAANLGCFIYNSPFSEDEIFDYARYTKMKTKGDRAANKPVEFLELKEKFKDLERNGRIADAITKQTNNVRGWRHLCVDYIHGISNTEFKFPISREENLTGNARKAYESKAHKKMLERFNAPLITHGSPLKWFDNAYAALLENGVEPKVPTHKFPFYVSCYGFRGSPQATIVLTFKEHFQASDNDLQNEIMTQWWDALIGLGTLYAVDIKDNIQAPRKNPTSASAIAYACLLMRILVRYADQGNEINTSQKMPIEVVYDEAAFEMLPHIINVLLDKNFIDKNFTN